MRGRLISTKRSQPTKTDPISGILISKDTGHEKVKTFIGKSFAIVPESLNNSAGGGDGHFYADSRNDLVQGYHNHSHGIIKGLFGPFYYNDGTDDYYYDFNVKLSNSQSAAAIIEYGERMWVPYSVSPHIVWNDKTNANWEGVGVALVKKGSYGDDAIITKLCEGTETQCNKSMSAAAALCTCCAESDAKISKSITSLIQSAASQEQMSNVTPTTGTNTNFNPAYINPSADITAENKPKEILTPAIPEEKPKEKQVTMTPQEYEELMKIKTEKETLTKTVEDLQNEYKTNILNQIFTTETIKDDGDRKILFDKYFVIKDIKIVRDLYQDFNRYIVPTIKDNIKAELAKETIAPITTKEEDAKRKSSAGSLKPEPKVDSEKDRDSAGSIKTQKVNEAKLIHDAIFGRSR